MIIQKISPNLKDGKLISVYNNVPSIFKGFQDQQDFSSFFRRAGSILHESLTVVYARNSSILYGAVHNPITFSQL